MKNIYLIANRDQLVPQGIILELMKSIDYIVFESDLTMDEIREKLKNDKDDQNTERKRPLRR